MLIGYFDESDHSSGTELFALAAFVSDDLEWAQFDKQWRRALDQNGAPYLHIREASILKYLPSWYLQAQASGTFDGIMRQKMSDPDNFISLLSEMTPNVSCKARGISLV